jgi:hypothetical protein
MRLDRKHWDSALLSPNVVQELDDLYLSGELAARFPALKEIVGFGDGREHKDLWLHTRHVVAQTIPAIHIRWAALFHDVGKPRCYSKVAGEVKFIGHEAVSAKTFRRAAQDTGFFSKDEARDIEFLIYNLGHVEEYDRSWTDSAVRRLYKLAGAHFDDLVALARADITTKHQNLRRAHHERMHELRTRAEELARLDAIPPALIKGLGEALMAEFGLAPSKELGVLMSKLKTAVEAGELPRSAPVEEAVAFARAKFL